MIKFRLTPEQSLTGKSPSLWTITQYPGSAAERSVYSLCPDEALYLCWSLFTGQVSTLPEQKFEYESIPTPSSQLTSVAVDVGWQLSCIFECDRQGRPVAFTGPLCDSEVLGGLASYIFAGRVMWGFTTYEQWHAIKRQRRQYRGPVAMLEQVVDTRPMMQGVCNT